MNVGLTVEYVKNLKWANQEHTIFDCIVKYKEFDEEHPSGINPNDKYDHILEVWNKAINGDYGVIEAYEPPNTDPVPPIGDPLNTPVYE
jgi:hypothetical protein